MQSILKFMYLGKADVESSNLDIFLAVAQELEVKGLPQLPAAAAPPNIHQPPPNNHQSTSSTRQLPPNIPQSTSNLLQSIPNVLQNSSDDSSGSHFVQPPPPTLRANNHAAANVHQSESTTNVLQQQGNLLQPMLSTPRLLTRDARVTPREEDLLDDDDDTQEMKLKPKDEFDQNQASVLDFATEDPEQDGQEDECYHDYDERNEEEEENEDDEEDDEEEEEGDQDGSGYLSQATDNNQNNDEVPEGKRREAFWKKYIKRIGARLFKCTICGKQLTSKHSVEDHIEAVHDPGRFIYKCSKCHRELESMTSMYNHGRRVHSGITRKEILKAMRMK